MSWSIDTGTIISACGVPLVDDEQRRRRRAVGADILRRQVRRVEHEVTRERLRDALLLVDRDDVVRRHHVDDAGARRRLERAVRERGLHRLADVGLGLALGAHRRDELVLREERLHALGVHTLRLDRARDAVIDDAHEAVLRLARLHVAGLVVDVDAGLRGDGGAGAASRARAISLSRSGSAWAMDVAAATATSAPVNAMRGGMPPRRLAPPKGCCRDLRAASPV